MIDSMTITTKWNKLFDWRYANISRVDILDEYTEPVTCFLSSNAWGLKGRLPGGRHSWISSFDGTHWKTYEITDLETVEIQQGNILYAKYSDKSLKQLIISNRFPATKWFGNTPRIDYVTKFLDLDVKNYPMNQNIDLVTNNCNTFLSYVTWKYQIPLSKHYVGYKNKDFWNYYADKYIIT